MEFELEHPQWSGRNCRDCQMFRFEQGRIAISRQTGEQIRNTRPVNCKATPCRCDGPWRKPMLTPVQRVVYERYRKCKLMNALPRAGGIDAQNPLEMRMFETIALAEKAVENRVRAAMIQKAGPLALMMFPMK